MRTFIDRLAAHGVRARIDGREIVVTRASEQDEEIFDVIRDAAVDLEYPLRQLHARQRSLEDVYIQTVSGEVVGAQVGGAGGS